jgi:hypothetical protein
MDRGGRLSFVFPGLRPNVATRRRTLWGPPDAPSRDRAGIRKLRANRVCRSRSQLPGKRVSSHLAGARQARHTGATWDGDAMMPSEQGSIAL